MPAKLTPEETAARRETILLAARWCFLNFGFAKTSLDDIAQRANISRTLLYRNFKDKEAIFTAVFTHWLVSRHPGAMAAAKGPGTPVERLFEVCRLLVVEPWNDMVGAPMSHEFHDVCDRLDPAIGGGHRQLLMNCAEDIIGDRDVAEIFLLALDGMIGDDPTAEVLAHRVRVLSARFVHAVDPA